MFHCFVWRHKAWRQLSHIRHLRVVHGELHCSIARQDVSRHDDVTSPGWRHQPSHIRHLRVVHCELHCSIAQPDDSRHDDVTRRQWRHQPSHIRHLRVVHGEPHCSIAQGMTSPALRTGDGDVISPHISVISVLFMVSSTVLLSQGMTSPEDNDVIRPHISVISVLFMVSSTVPLLTLPEASFLSDLQQRIFTFVWQKSTH